MGPSTEDDANDDDEPGQMSKGAKNKGRKTTSEDKVGRTVASGSDKRFKALMALF